MEQPTSAPEETVVVWEFWRAGYERSYHGEPGVVELGNIGDVQSEAPEAQ